MAETAVTSSLDMVLDGATDEIKKTVLEALAIYATPSKNAQDDQTKASKLRAAFIQVQKWLIQKKLPRLNDAQWLFLSTGALTSKVTLEPGDPPVEAELMPEAVYEYLVKSRLSKTKRPVWAMPILDVEDRIMAIARGELVPLDPRQTKRRPKAARPIGADQLKVKVQGRMENTITQFKEALAALEKDLALYDALREEKVHLGVRNQIDALKKFAAMGAGGPVNAQKAKLMASIGEKMPGVVQSFGSLGAQLEKAGKEVAFRAQIVEAKLKELNFAAQEIQKLESGGDTTSALFDPATVDSLWQDSDMLASIVVRGSETAEGKIPYSGARILVSEQWKNYEGPPENCIATPDAVTAAIKKIGAFHVNVFPKDEDGNFVLLPVVIEPVRNYVEFFDDRMVMALVSGESGLVGPKMSLTPLEIMVLKMCGLYLTKDDIYDYRGEINAGTFIGDYSGKVEKKTQVKWTGSDKKFSMAASSEVTDGATRGETVNDYVSFFFAMANGVTPPQKLSRRKIAVILRYCIFESVEKTVALTLLHAAQAEPEESKATILKHAKTHEEARALITKAFVDPQVARQLGDRDFFIKKLFGN